MNAVLVDTHVFVWLLSKNKLLGAVALDAIKRAASINLLYVSAITPWEIAMLVSKGRLILERDIGVWLDMALALPGFRIVPLSPAIAVASTRLPGEINSDPADRIIVATARHLGVPLLTADENLLSYSARGHVKAIQATK